MKPFFFYMVVLLGFVAVPLFAADKLEKPKKTAPAKKDSLPWGTDYEKALADAKAQKKQVLLYFDLEGCPPCANLKQAVFEQQEFRNYALKNFVLVKVQEPIPSGMEKQNGELKKKFEIQKTGWPQVFLLDSSGESMGDVGGGCGNLPNRNMVKRFKEDVEKARAKASAKDAAK